jgi:hypothetical protein
MDESKMKKKGSHITLWFIVWVIIILLLGEYALSMGYPWKFSNLEPYMLRKQNDDWTHNAFEIERIKKWGQADNRELIVFIGGSASIEVISDDTIISERLTESIGREITFTSLCANWQSPGENATIANRIKSFGGTLLIGMEPQTFRIKIDRQLILDARLRYYYLTITSNINSILSEYGFNPGFTHRIYLFRTAMVIGEIFKKSTKCFITSGFKLKSITHNRHAFGDMTPVNEDDREKQIIWLKKVLILYEENYRLNMDLLKETIDIAQSNGINVVIVDLPYNPVFIESINKFNPHYDNLIKDLVSEKGIGYIDMRHAADYTPEDFRDVHHLRSQGQVKFTNALIVKLAEYISQNRN